MFHGYSVKDANEKGKTGIQVPPTSTIHEFFEMIDKDGEQNTVWHYKSHHLLSDDVISALHGAYATGTTVEQEKKLLSKLARYSHYHTNNTTHQQEKIEGREIHD
jgi:hypothetical protein